MKIETDKVKKHLDEIKYQLSGMEESIRSGDDGLLESLLSQIADAKKEVTKFISLHLTEKVEDPLDFNGRSYLNNYEQIRRKINNDEQLTPLENTQYTKHNLYQWLKRKYKEKINSGFEHADNETNAVLCNIVNEDKHYNRMESQWLYTFFAVYEDLTTDLNKIREEQRNNSKQQKLFE